MCNISETENIVTDISIMICVHVSIDLGFAGNRKIEGSIGGISTHTSAQKVWLVFQALGDIAFSYPYTQIVLEIQVSATYK